MSSAAWYEFIVQDVIHVACAQWHTKVAALSQQEKNAVCSESENKIILMTIRILLIAHEVISINKSSCVLQRSHLLHKSHQTSAGTLSDAPPGAHAGILLHKCKFFQQSIKHTFQYKCTKAYSHQSNVRVFLVSSSRLEYIISDKVPYSILFFKSMSFSQLSLHVSFRIGGMYDMMIWW